MMKHKKSLLFSKGFISFIRITFFFLHSNWIELFLLQTSYKLEWWYDGKYTHWPIRQFSSLISQNESQNSSMLNMLIHPYLMRNWTLFFALFVSLFFLVRMSVYFKWKFLLLVIIIPRKARKKRQEKYLKSKANKSIYGGENRWMNTKIIFFEVFIKISIYSYFIEYWIWFDL